eukprot:6659104-Alexandrium_andersonii.AAC.1
MHGLHGAERCGSIVLQQHCSALRADARGCESSRCRRSGCTAFDHTARGSPSGPMARQQGPQRPS